MAQKPPPSNVVPFRRPENPGGGFRFRFPAWVPKDLVGTATGWIVLANLIVWLAMIAASYGAGVLTPFPPSTTYAFGSLVPSLVPTEPWRLISSTFIHADIGHIAMNMAILWFTGRQLERAYGPGRLVLLYFVACLTGSLFSMTWHLVASPGTSVGASGGVLGVVAGLAAFYWRATGRHSDPTKQWLWFCGLGLIGGLITSSLGMAVDNAAHLGGMVGGAAMSVFFAGRPAFSPQITRGVLASGVLLIAGSLGLAVGVGDKLERVDAEALVPPSRRVIAEALEKKDFDTAEKELANAVREVPDDPILRSMHASTLRELGRSAEADRELVAAETLLEGLRRREPGSANVAFAHASVLSAQGRDAEAGKALVDAANGDGDAATLARIAEQLEARGLLEEARKAAAKARLRDSGNAEFRALHDRIKEKIANPAATPEATVAP